MAFSVTPLGPDTWDDFADLVVRNNGIYGGCWCVAYHLIGREFPELTNQQYKKLRVDADDAHAALVRDDDGVVQGWAQYGPAAEIPGFKHRRAYEQDPPPPPDWRIACVFVDKDHRGRGVAHAAVAGAVELIAAAGGGLTEAISETTAGREAQSRFLFSATAELYESHGFARGRQVGKHAWILSRQVEATTG